MHAKIDATVILGGHFGPEKKIYLAPPPRKFPADTLPAPRPPPSSSLLETPPPSWDFQYKTDPSHPLSV